MKKLRLDPDRLRVDSFALQLQASGEGTVLAHGPSAVALCATRSPCPTGASCDLTLALTCVECSPRCTLVLTA
jgi:hypothetical protein